MKVMLLGGLIMISSAAGPMSCLADGMFWVVGNRATNSCDIVSRNPVIDGDIWFGDGPYKSLADARLSRKTIKACPQTPEPAASAPADQSD